jgi:SOS response associated peptidase (SRAP)
MRWALVPYWWNKTLKDSMRLASFNARVETVTTKPFFREPFKKRPCLMFEAHLGGDHERKHVGPSRCGHTTIARAVTSRVTGFTLQLPAELKTSRFGDLLGRQVLRITGGPADIDWRGVAWTDEQQGISLGWYAEERSEAFECRVPLTAS